MESTDPSHLHTYNTITHISTHCTPAPHCYRLTASVTYPLHHIHLNHVHYTHLLRLLLVVVVLSASSFIELNGSILPNGNNFPQFRSNQRHPPPPPPSFSSSSSSSSSSSRRSESSHSRI